MNLQQLSDKELATLLSAIKIELQSRHEDDYDFDALEEGFCDVCDCLEIDSDEIHDQSIDKYHSQK